MSIPDSIVGTLPGTQLSLSSLLERLRMQGRLRELILEALAEQLVDDKARQAGLSVTREELQSAADAFRRRHGLTAAADTHAWLSGHGMSARDLRANLEHDLLAAKLRRHLTATQTEQHFTAHQAGYERLRIAQVCVGRDDLASELASQVRDDGRELDAVAAEHRVRLVRGESFRRDLASPLAEALASAKPRELVGPMASPQGFLLVLIEDRRLPELDSDTRQRIENELFNAWLVEHMREATSDVASMGNF